MANEWDGHDVVIKYEQGGMDMQLTVDAKDLFADKLESPDLLDADSFLAVTASYFYQNHRLPVQGTDQEITLKSYAIQGPDGKNLDLDIHPNGPAIEMPNVKVAPVEPPKAEEKFPGLNINDDGDVETIIGTQADLDAHNAAFDAFYDSLSDEQKAMMPDYPAPELRDGPRSYTSMVDGNLVRYDPVIVMWGAAPPSEEEIIRHGQDVATFRGNLARFEENLTPEQREAWEALKETSDTFIQDMDNPLDRSQRAPDAEPIAADPNEVWKILEAPEISPDPDIVPASAQPKTEQPAPQVVLASSGIPLGTGNELIRDPRVLEIQQGLETAGFTLDQFGCDGILGAETRAKIAEACPDLDMKTATLDEVLAAVNELEPTNPAASISTDEPDAEFGGGMMGAEATSNIKGLAVSAFAKAVAAPGLAPLAPALSQALESKLDDNGPVTPGAMS